MNKSKKLLAIFFAFVCLVNFTQGQSMQTWEGVLDVGVQKLRLKLNITRADDGTFSGEMVSVDQSGLSFPFDSIEVKNNELTWEIKQLGVSYKGTINEDQSEVDGDFTQGRTYKVKFKKTEASVPAKHIETWQGTLVAGPQTFDFQFRFFDEDGLRTVRLDSFTEKIDNLPGNLVIKGDDVAMDLPITKAKYVGVINADKDVIEGKWIQAGKEFPLTIRKLALEQTRKLTMLRPQTPEPPFPYDSKDFLVSPAELNNRYEMGLNLAGTLTTPKGSGPFPVVILISGSGPQDRDETILGHKPFAVIADNLTRRGIAVLRYDERGVGKSIGDVIKDKDGNSQPTGVYADATSEEFAMDVEALMDWVGQQPKIDRTKIGLIGHSEGGYVAPMIAARRTDVAAIVMLAGPGVPGAEIIMNQSRLIAKASGAPDSTLRFQDDMVRDILLQLIKPAGIDESFADSLAEKLKDDLPAEIPAEALAPMVKQSIDRMNSPWMKFFVQYDPAPALKKVRSPVLAVVGEKDLQVDPELNMPVIEAALKAGGNKDFELKRFPNLNHLFQNCDKGLPTEYKNIEETFDVNALNFVGQWLEKRLK